MPLDVERLKRDPEVTFSANGLGFALKRHLVHTVGKILRFIVNRQFGKRVFFAISQKHLESHDKAFHFASHAL